MKFKGVYQHNTKDCGVACLISIIKYYRGNNTFENIRYLTKCDNNGVTALNLINASKKLGFKSRGLRCKYKDLNKLKLPLICHLILENGYNHYVIIYKINNKYIYIFDPTSGNKKYNYKEFNKLWSNVVIELIPFRKLDTIKSNNNFLLNIIKHLLKYFILIFIFSIISIILSLLLNYYFKLLLDYNNIYLVFIIFCILIFIKEINDYIRNKFLIKLENNVDINLFNNTHKKILSLPYYYFNSRSSGDIISKFYDLEYVKELIIKVPITLLVDSVLILISSFALLKINKKLFIIFIILCFIYISLLLFFNKQKKIMINNNQESNSEKNMVMIENIRSINTIKNMNLEDNRNKKYNYYFKKFINNRTKYEKNNNFENFIMNIVLLIGINIVLYYGVSDIKNNIIGIGDLLLFNSLMIYFLEPLKNFCELNSIIKNGINAYRRINEINLLDNNIIDNTVEIKTFDINIRNLSFSYNGYDNILKNKGLFIKDGEKVAVIGPSGCGKSTLFKILSKTYEINNNMIFLNNIDINKIDISKYLIYVSQEETLFNDTLYNNLVFDNNEYELSKIMKITKLDKVMKNRKISLNSIIEEDGLNLSKGERQKIILTRTLLKNKKIIILDEALSGVEEREEIEILKNILEEYKNNTIIYITHTYECTKIFDRIINFKED